MIKSKYVLGYAKKFIACVLSFIMAFVCINAHIEHSIADEDSATVETEETSVTLIGVSTASITDTMSYFSAVQLTAYSLGARYVFTYGASCALRDCIESLKKSNTFIICGEGFTRPSFSCIALNRIRTDGFSSSTLLSLEDGDLVKTDLALFAASYSGHRYKDKDGVDMKFSIVDVAVAKGAKHAVGFKNAIDNTVINRWIVEFYNKYQESSAKTVEDGAEYACSKYKQQYPDMTYSNVRIVNRR